ncbi:hypothetical protein BY996DRAFT_6418404 [Phakopsora pachyrhizi]|nr:hypothetical protein BY996DRAFT_6418404 [Phakopsora pachyrhizi]
MTKLNHQTQTLSQRFLSLIVPIRTDILKLNPPPSSWSSVFDHPTDETSSSSHSPSQPRTTKTSDLTIGSKAKRLTNPSQNHQHLSQPQKRQRRNQSESLTPSRNRNRPVRQKPKKRSKGHHRSEIRSEDEDDLFLSDYSEPETKLRERDPKESRRRLSALLKSRRALKKTKILKKEFLLKKIIPDSEDENQVDEHLRAANSSDESESESESESETDEEERERKQKEFIVDDIKDATRAQRIELERQKRQIPNRLKNNCSNSQHFSIACDYLTHKLVLPRVNWRKKVPEYDESCKHLENSIMARPLQVLESAGWTNRFRDELRARPYLTVQVNLVGKPGCGACNKKEKPGDHSVFLRGKKYDPRTLNHLQPTVHVIDDDDESGIDSFSDVSTLDGHRRVESGLDKSHIITSHDATTFLCGRDCATRAEKYHYFKPFLL